MRPCYKQGLIFCCYEFSSAKILFMNIPDNKKLTVTHYGIIVFGPGEQPEPNDFVTYDEAWSAFEDYKKDLPDSQVVFISREVVYGEWTVDENPVYEVSKRGR
jgi:hypothetical protein